MQVAFHFRQASDHGRDSFRVGKSVHNQRAEFFNSILKKTWIKKWQVTFETMMESGILDLDNSVHINCLQYTHLPLLQKELTTEQRLWNTHDIRKQRNVAGPFGKPDVLFTLPPQDGSLAAYLMLVEKFVACIERRDIHIPSTFAEANEIYELLANETF
ncbi:uncharacterized protein [Misgurnus anguillicaudatus]|uniref:uncharacterized protein isoform X2 n=1 Tax=Misgurnus anguillicaudatus TaxID=75329 RepID=UPI003CCF497B